MANQQLLFLPRPLPDSAFNRLFEPIRVKCALDTGRVLIDGNFIGERSFGLQAEVPFFRAFGSDGGLEATATPDPKFRSRMRPVLLGQVGLGRLTE